MLAAYWTPIGHCNPAGAGAVDGPVDVKDGTVGAEGKETGTVGGHGDAAGQPEGVAWST